MQTAINYLKQFAAWAIASWEKYASKYKDDLFFRTTIHIVALQAGFVLVCAGAFGLSLLYPTKGWAIFGGVSVFALLCGVLLARFTLGPARMTARHQKLFISN